MTIRSSDRPGPGVFRQPSSAGTPRSRASRDCPADADSLLGQSRSAVVLKLVPKRGTLADVAKETDHLPPNRGESIEDRRPSPPTALLPVLA